jgi:hypothetical protein
MKKQILLFATFMSMLSFANAQWQPTSLNSIGNGNTVTLLVTRGDTIYAGTIGPICKMFLSTNNGITWNTVMTNLQVMSLAVSGDTIFAGNGGVSLSTNNGNSWIAVDSGLTTSFVQALVKSGNNIFAGTWDRGVFLSTNIGGFWTPVNNGLTDTVVWSLAIKGNNIFAGTDKGVFLSTNNGNNWTAVNNGIPDTVIRALAISGNNIFAATWSGLYISSNNGSSWTEVNSGLPHCVSSFAVKGNNIFAGTDSCSSGVFMSSDNGYSWANIGLSGFYNISSLAASDSFIYAGTEPGVLWKRSLSDSGIYCSAQFSMVPDTTTLHHYYVINNASGIPPITYSWSWGDGTNDYIAYPTHTYSAAGFYNICLTITDSTGCTSTFCDSSYLQKSPNSIISVTVIPQVNTGINLNELSNRIMVYPNPSTDNITIESPQQATIEILNIQGQTILQQQIQQGKTDIDISGLAKGIYILRLNSNDKTAVTRIVKE